MKHSYLPKLWFLLFFLVSCCLNAAAQTGAVSGRILDENQQGLPGVTVLIEGTQLGSSTNAEGQYLIQNVPVGPRVVVASFVGFSTQRIPVTVTAGQTATVANTVLGENTTLLNEAVVIGYGTQRRQDLSGSVEQISERQFVKGQVTNPEQLVQGKVAGLQVTTNSGAPGAGSVIRIRGGSSLNAGNDPLFVIDGVPVDNRDLPGASNPLSLINPNDIESISVLKDASAAAIYGSRASNGVIIVTTKKGLQGEKLRVNVSSQNSVATPVRYVDVLSADEFRALVNERGNAQQKASLGTANTDWQKEIFRTAQTTDNNVSLTGAVGKLPFRASAGYLDQEGLLKRNDLKRYTGALSLTPVLLDGNLRVDMNVKGSWIDNNFSNQDAVGAAVFYDPTQPIFSSEGRFAPYGGYFQFLDNGSINTLATRNPVGLIEQNRRRSTVKRSIGNLQLDYKLPFLRDLSANLNLGYDIQRSRGTSVTDPNSGQLTGARLGRGIFEQYARDNNNRLLEAYLRYNKQIGGSRIELLGGHSYQSFDYKEYVFDDRDVFGQVFQQPADRPINGKDYFDPGYRLLSFYGRANYTLKDKYILTGTFRADGSSRFSEDNRWGYFPSAAFAWRLKEEGFLKNSSAVSDLKLRLSVGQTGQQDIGNRYYDYISLYTPSRNTAQYQLGNQFSNTLRAGLYNEELKWETSTTYNAGLDFGFFDGRISGALDAYQRKTTDLLSFIQVAALTNLSNEGFFNVGDLETRGVEANVNLGIVRGDKFDWSINANANVLRTEITRLTNVDNPNFVGNPTGGIAGGVGNNIQINSVGYQPQTFFVFQQVYDSNGKPVEGLYVDRNGDGVINGSDRYHYQSARPRAILGFGTNLTYGKASLAATLRSHLGNYVYNNVRSQSFFVQNSNGFVNNTTEEVNDSRFGSAQYFSDYFMENASFLRMENITLGYNFGNIYKDRANLNVSFAVQNLFTITNYTGLDPEPQRDGNSGIDNTIYPRPRTFTVGLNFGF
ncbi:SusC/RagA family TonB-linked outer membrane protein [Hymenobacter oligotrophus]|uniref:SusC/RagA family TonB-linked outer membrane protein n=1 Tax=Hymenobacter oligotrophus TaxID=2319843 RepID=A0A3B7QYT3_9BACT|nr:SusC/RagA family TonB-linked outer membrane protein [Hymenobacter oligotrophus]AYA36765.1 SusC/RagA family TonB-linked outer membrane protein [Hymenobacter oligotrophus]